MDMLEILLFQKKKEKKSSNTVAAQRDLDETNSREALEAANNL